MAHRHLSCSSHAPSLDALVAAASLRWIAAAAMGVAAAVEEVLAVPFTSASLLLDTLATGAALVDGEPHITKQTNKQIDTSDPALSVTCMDKSTTSSRSNGSPLPRRYQGSGGIMDGFLECLDFKAT